MPLITVFTPTYNRALLLSRLYESLLRQSFVDFEWVIVDDGSIDNTKELIASFKESGLNIHYYYQHNAGKHFAINHGVRVAKGELFFILDSDDLLPANALALVALRYATVEGLPHVGGVAGRKAFLNNELIGSASGINDQLLTVFDFRYEYGIKGDMCEVYKTDVLKEFPFPEFKGEKFCPEALVWNRIGTKYQLLWFDEIIYNAEYQPEGLTAKIFEVRKKAPRATTICYEELSKAPIPIKSRFKAAINFWRFAFFLDKQSFSEKWRRIRPLLSIFALPVASILHLKNKFSS